MQPGPAQPTPPLCPHPPLRRGSACTHTVRQGGKQHTPCASLARWLLTAARLYGMLPPLHAVLRGETGTESSNSKFSSAAACSPAGAQPVLSRFAARRAMVPMPDSPDQLFRALVASGHACAGAAESELLHHDARRHACEFGACDCCVRKPRLRVLAPGLMQAHHAQAPSEGGRKRRPSSALSDSMNAASVCCPPPLLP